MHWCKNEEADKWSYPGLHFWTLCSLIFYFIDFQAPLRARRSSGGCAGEAGASR
jgi:hypothetical protein